MNLSFKKFAKAHVVVSGIVIFCAFVAVARANDNEREDEPGHREENLGAAYSIAINLATRLYDRRFHIQRPSLQSMIRWPTAPQGAQIDLDDLEILAQADHVSPNGYPDPITGAWERPLIERLQQEWTTDPDAYGLISANIYFGAYYDVVSGKYSSVNDPVPNTDSLYWVSSVCSDQEYIMNPKKSDGSKQLINNIRPLRWANLSLLSSEQMSELVNIDDTEISLVRVEQKGRAAHKPIKHPTCLSLMDQHNAEMSDVDTNILYTTHPIRPPQRESRDDDATVTIWHSKNTLHSLASRNPTYRQPRFHRYLYTVTFEGLR